MNWFKKAKEQVSQLPTEDEVDYLIEQASLKKPALGNSNVHQLNGLLQKFLSIYETLKQHPEKQELLMKFNFLRKIINEYILNGNMNDLSKRYKFEL